MLLLLQACWVGNPAPVDTSLPCSQTTWYQDLDGDGWGTDLIETSCGLPEGFAVRDGDCDDADASVHPDAADLCDGAAFLACQAEDAAPSAGDCDDGDAAVHPDADETCNAVDDDCDGIIDEPTGSKVDPACLAVSIVGTHAGGGFGGALSLHRYRRGPLMDPNGR